MAKDRPQIEATLVVEALNPSEVRSSYFKQTWARLFNAGDYYVDLAFEMKPESGELRGQVLLPGEAVAVSKGKVQLYQADQKLTSTLLDTSGAFLLGLQKAGTYDLKVELDQAILSISPLEFS